MMKKIINCWINVATSIGFCLLMLPISSAYSQTFYVGAEGQRASYSRVSWGQSFEATHDGKLSQLKFHAASASRAGFTFVLREGANCNGAVVFTQRFSGLANGENTLVPSSNIQVSAGSKYYFSVKSNDNSLWKIRFSNQDVTKGNLRTYRYGTFNQCDYDFKTFDWNFKVAISDNSPTPSEPVQTHAKEIDLYILAGQSNAQGYASQGANYPYSLREDAQIKFNWTLIDTPHKSKGWGAMERQSGRFQEGYFGPEVSFARALNKEKNNVAVFKYTRPGSSVFGNWKTPGEGGYYDRMVSDYKTAKNQLIKQGYSVSLKGFVWIQGESDLKNVNYESDLSRIIYDVRNSVANIPDLNVLLGVDEQYPGMQGSHVLAAHKNIAASDPNIIFTSMLNLPKADSTHLTSSGAIVQGKRLFDGIKCLENGVIDCFDNERASNIISKGSTVSYKRAFWGQGFIPEHSGLLRELRFNAAKTDTGNYTLTIKEGAYCDGAAIHQQTIKGIVNGENIVTLTTPKKVIANRSYCFTVRSNANRYWNIRFGSSDKVAGNLFTHRTQDVNRSDYRFPRFDWDFDIFIER